jgi:hypothetical protein
VIGLVSRVPARWAAAVCLALCAAASVAVAQAPPTASPMGIFRVEEDTGAPTRGAVAGWVYNDGRETVGLLRMRMDVLDEGGQVVAVERGWAYGNLRPGDRAYFRIPLPGRQGTRRISVESFVIQSLQSP